MIRWVCMYASACDCREGDAYGQTNRPNPVIRDKSNAFPPACDLGLHLHAHCAYWTWPQERPTVKKWQRCHVLYETRPGRLIEMRFVEKSLFCFLEELQIKSDFSKQLGHLNTWCNYQQASWEIKSEEEWQVCNNR